ncbi:YibL family ribosome-associated protein [Pantoea sp. 1.19]|uniref:YibL family ribosome-associated protein n=1 Tax=Pantoea sp. 1.19 TaxID=1925589 RepID=UPI0009488AFD|nr:YibL family ribosome-associated protein [Pantoea sp. 1.19]
MKEQVNAEIKRLSDQLDAHNHKATALQESGDAEKLGEVVKEIETLEVELTRLRGVRDQTLSKEAQKLQSLPFSRAITKKEQADMGALKKKVRGLIVVHPMTALGREMGLTVMTGFARSAF